MIGGQPPSDAISEFNNPKPLKPVVGTEIPSLLLFTLLVLRHGLNTVHFPFLLPLGLKLFAYASRAARHGIYCRIIRSKNDEKSYVRVYQNTGLSDAVAIRGDEFYVRQFGEMGVYGDPSP